MTDPMTTLARENERLRAELDQARKAHERTLRIVRAAMAWLAPHRHEPYTKIVREVHALLVQIR